MLNWYLLNECICCNQFNENSRIIPLLSRFTLYENLKIQINYSTKLTCYCELGRSADNSSKTLNSGYTLIITFIRFIVFGMHHTADKQRPSGRSWRRSSDTKFKRVPSFFHSIFGDGSEYAEQFSITEEPLTESVSTGSTKK